MINFPFGTNGKLIILGVPILKHITVISYHKNFNIIIKFNIYWRTLLEWTPCLSMLCAVRYETC